MIFTWTMLSFFLSLQHLYSHIYPSYSATGLFTRRFVQSNEYTRVIGCDYSTAMLLEARSRMTREVGIQLNGKTRLDLVRCDVAQIPMQNSSVDALHAGAAMHCWPDVDAGLGEIHRVLKTGGRYFATTFLSRYFRFANNADTGVQQQAFQYFESLEQIKNLLIQAGFQKDLINVTLLGEACIIIKAEKS
jgi:ubiquinone/menaquinone biosynthesis C-methylase UbiE